MNSGALSRGAGVVVGVVCLLAWGRVCWGAGDGGRPNVVFVVVDDLGWRDFGYAGSSFYETPNIDRLAGESMRFGNAYAAMIENLDMNIGRLLKGMEEAGVGENTIFILTSDNGGLATAEGSPTCNAPARDGKGWMYDGGTRVPLLVRWPGRVKGGTSCDAPVVSADFYPTVLEGAGVAVPEGHVVDGVSLVPLLTQSSASLARGAIFWHYPHYGNQGGTPGSSMREGDWKLIEFYEPPAHVELYNLKEDPGETKNVAGEHPDVARKLEEELVAWRKSVGGKVPQPNPDYPKK